MFKIRDATKADIPSIVSVSAATLRDTTDVPPTHTQEEVTSYYQEKVFSACTMLVAEIDGEVVGYAGYRKDWLDHLRVFTEHHGKGIGKALLDRAKQAYPYLQLLCFQHIPARAFYRRHGFVEVEYTDGRDNDEKLPDVRMEWHRHNS